MSWRGMGVSMCMMEMTVAEGLRELSSLGVWLAWGDGAMSQVYETSLRVLRG
jgi:hypothetical protein